MFTKQNAKDLVGKVVKQYDQEIVNQKIANHDGKIASTTAAGHMSAAMVSKLNGIQAGAEVNQNAISNVKVGSTVLSAAAKQSTLEIAAGTNISLNADAATGKVTITGKTFTKSDVGLGNVTNESKATMFTNPAFTGVPTAPTAAKGTATTQIATTAFVADAVSKIAAEGHTHNSSEVKLMTGYAKPSTTSAISTNDSLNAAIGKLEKALDGKSDTHTHPYRPNTWVPTWNDVTNKPDVATNASAQSKADAALASAKSYADQKVASLVGAAPEALDTLQELAEAVQGNQAGVTDLLTKVGTKADKTYVDSELAKKANATHNHTANQITAMTGYTKASAVGTLSATDSLNVAMGKLEKNIEAKMDIHTHPYRANNWVPTFAEVTSKPTTLAGYGITDAAPKADTANRLSALEGINAASRLAALEAPITISDQDITDVLNFIKA